MSRMELSSVYNRIHYLVALKNAQRDDRITMLQNITPGQLDCVGETAHRIYDQTFLLLVQDLGNFDDMSLLLRFLFAIRDPTPRSECLSVELKKTTLVHYHRMIPRLLRTYNLQAIIQDQIHSHRES